MYTSREYAEGKFGICLDVECLPFKKDGGREGRGREKGRKKERRGYHVCSMVY